MRKTGLLSAALIIGLTLSGTAHANKGRTEPARPHDKPEQTREEAAKARATEQAGKLRGNSLSTVATTLARVAGLTQSMKLEAAMQGRPYSVEVVNKESGAPRSEYLTIDIAEQAQKLAQNVETLSKTSGSELKLKLAKATSSFLVLAGDRYAGTDKPELALARDAWARQLQTAVELTSPNSTAKNEVVESHIRFIEKANSLASGMSARTEAAVMLAAIQATRGTADRPLSEAEVKEELETIKDCKL